MGMQYSPEIDLAPYYNYTNRKKGEEKLEQNITKDLNLNQNEPIQQYLC